jgi:hypothetical protein
MALMEMLKPNALALPLISISPYVLHALHGKYLNSGQKKRRAPPGHAVGGATKVYGKIRTR